MMDSKNASPLAERMKAMQIIWFALLAGVGTFAMVALFRGPETPKEDLFLSNVLTIFAATNAVLSFIVPGLVAKTALRQAAPELKVANDEAAYPHLTMIYQTSLIVALAMLEAGAFSVLTGYLLEGVWWTLLIAGVLAFLMLLHFPSLGRVEAWCRTQLETIRMGAM